MVRIVVVIHNDSATPRLYIHANNWRGEIFLCSATIVISVFFLCA